MSNQVVRKTKRIITSTAPAPVSTVVRKEKSEPQEKKDKVDKGKKDKVDKGKKDKVKKDTVDKGKKQKDSVNKSTEEEEEEEIITIDNTDLISTVTKKDVRDEVSKEEMIEQVEYQREILVKNRSRYNDKDYKTKLETIEKLLSKLKVGWVKKNLDDMADIRKRIDKIVLDNKIDAKHFKQKIDLTGEKTDDDPTVKLLVQSRKQFEKMQYLKIPKELEKKDPFKNKGKGFANQPMPNDMLKMINFS